MANIDVEKLFIGGISRHTSDVTLKDYFNKYGVVSHSHIAKDRLTGIPRGFGFITFDNPDINKDLFDTTHLIDGKKVEVKRAIPRNEQQQQQQQQLQQIASPIHQQTSKVMGENSDGSYGASNNNQVLNAKKIFVGGLSANLTEEEFKSYFEKFGIIKDVVVMHDNNTNKPRGFGFITFDSEEVVDKIMQIPHHELAGKRVEVKRAIRRELSKNLSHGNNPSFGGYPTYISYPSQLPISTGYYYNNGGLYSGGYPIGGGYGFLGYGMPVISPSSSSGGVSRPVNYGTGYYTSDVNVGFPMMGMASPYSAIMDPRVNGRVNQGFISNGHAIQPVNGLTRSDGNGSSFKMGKGDVNMKKSSRALDAQAQPKVAPAGQSS